MGEDLNLKVRDIERSFRRFSDYADDVESANHQTHRQFLHVLIHHCEIDPIMSLVTRQLKANQNIDIEKWYVDFSEAGNYALPTDEEDRLALFYLLLLSFDKGQHGILDFGINAYGITVSVHPIKKELSCAAV